ARPIAVVLNDRPEVFQDTTPAHLAQTKEQAARIIEHDSRVAASVHQFADEIGDAAVAPGEHRRVVIAVDVLTLHHILQLLMIGAVRISPSSKIKGWCMCRARPKADWRRSSRN